MAESQDLQKEYADAQSKGNMERSWPKKDLACKLNIPKKIRTHPMFYVGLLKSSHDPAQLSVEALAPGRQVAAGRQRVVEPQDAE
ncbi:hypothetical protein PC110_g21762, partial [Phytophthora cactorum]